MPEQTVQPVTQANTNRTLVIVFVGIVFFVLGVVVTTVLINLTKSDNKNDTNMRPVATQSEITESSSEVPTADVTSTPDADGFKTETIEYDGEYMSAYIYELKVPSDAIEEELNMDGPLGHKFKGTDFELVIFEPYEGYSRIYPNLTSVGRNPQRGYEVFKYDVDNKYGWLTTDADIKGYTTNVKTEGACGVFGSPDEVMAAPCGTGVIQYSKVDDYNGVEFQCWSADSSVCDKVALSVKRIE